MSSKNFAELGFVETQQGSDKKVEKINFEAVTNNKNGDFVVNLILNGKLNSFEQDQLIKLIEELEVPCTHFLTKEGVKTSSVSIVRQTHVFNTIESTRQERRERNILYVGNGQNLINQHNLKKEL